MGNGTPGPYGRTRTPRFFSVVIELRGGLTLHPAQVRLLERLFAGCSRVTVTKLHGGFSGSLVCA